MFICSYNGYNLPPLPEWTNEYEHVWIRREDLISELNYYVHATNKFSYNRYHDGFMGASDYNYVSYSGKRAEYVDGAWGDPKNASGKVWGERGQYPTIWSKTDIYGFSNINDVEGSKYIVVHGSTTICVEYGWSDFGEDKDSEALERTEIKLFEGWSIAGGWMCRVVSSDSTAKTFEWYKNGELIYTQTGGTESDCKPSAKELGSFSYYCKVTFESGKTITAGPMTALVEVYDYHNPDHKPGNNPDYPYDPDNPNYVPEYPGYPDYPGEEWEDPFALEKQLVEAFWKGFAAGCATLRTPAQEIIATLTDGVLYIEKAPAKLNGNTLEVI